MNWSPQSGLLRPKLHIMDDSWTKAKRPPLRRITLQAFLSSEAPSESLQTVLSREG
jgi:hypothetical protein